MINTPSYCCTFIVKERDINQPPFIAIEWLGGSPPKLGDLDIALGLSFPAGADYDAQFAFAKATAAEMQRKIESVSVC